MNDCLLILDKCVNKSLYLYQFKEDCREAWVKLPFLLWENDLAGLQFHFRRVREVNSRDLPSDILPDTDAFLYLQVVLLSGENINSGERKFLSQLQGKPKRNER